MNRLLFAAIGVAICLAAWFAPLTQTGLGHFSAHMLRHMSVVAIASLLLVLGLPRLATRVPPSPLLAALAEFLVVWSWHLPILHDAARAHPAVFALEQASFLAAGFLVWASVLQPARELAGAGGLLLTSMHMTLLGALLILSSRPLYALHGSTASALADQQLGGMIMLGIGTPLYLVAGVLLVGVVLRGEGERREAA